MQVRLIRKWLEATEKHLSMDEINTEPVPEDLQDQALWFLYDLQKEGILGKTYTYDVPTIGTLIVKLSR